MFIFRHAAVGRNKKAEARCVFMFGHICVALYIYIYIYIYIHGPANMGNRRVGALVAWRSRKHTQPTQNSNEGRQVDVVVHAITSKIAK